MRCGAGCEMGAVVGGIVPGDRAVGPQLAVCARVAETRGADHARRRGYGDEVPSISADAEMLCAKGLTAYPTTIAKIEAATGQSRLTSWSLWQRFSRSASTRCLGTAPDVARTSSSRWRHWSTHSGSRSGNSAPPSEHCVRP